MIRHIAVILVAGLLIAADAPTSADYKALQGTWSLIGVELGGKTLAEKTVMDSKMTMAFKDDMVVTKANGQLFSEETFQIDSSKKPKEITLNVKSDGKIVHINGIYVIESDTLKICVSPGGKPAPKEMKTTKDSTEEMRTLKRVK